MKDFKPQIQMMQIDLVKPYDRNSKIHSREQVLEIASQIANAGFDQPIVIDKAGVIIKGHGRLLASKYLNLTEGPVIVQDLSPDQAKAIRIADNKVAEAPWDEAMLKVELESLKAIEGFDLGSTAFSDDEIAKMLGIIEPENLSEQDAFSKINGTGARKDIRQITFFLDPTQMEAVNAALDVAYKDLETAGVSLEDVPNKSGVALAHLCMKVMGTIGTVETPLNGTGEVTGSETDRLSVS